MPGAVIELSEVSKKFGEQEALSEISFEVFPGKIIAIAGPDGAGKTTLLRLMAALLLPSSGKISILGEDTVQFPERIHTQIGYMPQRFGLYEDLTVLQNLSLYADLKGVEAKERKASFEKLLAFTNLGSFTERLAGQLSGGMKQKLGLACTLLKTPHLLLLDEPSVGVDPISRRELWEMVHSLLKEGISIIWSTAYLDEAEKCDEVILLNGGKILYAGNPSGLTQRVEGRTFQILEIQKNRREFLSEVLEHEEIIDGSIQGKNIRLVTKEGEPKNLPEGKCEGVTPRFEDAFIDILGGGPGGHSALADRIAEKKKEKKIVIEAQHLTKKFGDFTAVQDMNLQIESGQVFGLLGPNGAGKSTTFKMLCGLLKPTSGKAFVNGLDLQKAPSQARAQIGYMAQKFSLYGGLSVWENIHFFSGVYSLNHIRNEVEEEMIEIFRFEPYLNHPAISLPLGYRQRLALCCALMHQPEVLFLDEATSGVDPLTRREFWNHINGLVEKGVTVLISTHFMDEAEYCDQISLVYQGSIIHSGTPDSLKELAKSSECPFPTLEDAFIAAISRHGKTP